MVVQGFTAFNLGEKGSHCSVFENEVSTAHSFPSAARVGARIPLKGYCNSQGRRQGLLGRRFSSEGAEMASESQSILEILTGSAGVLHLGYDTV